MVVMIGPMTPPALAEEVARRGEVLAVGEARPRLGRVLELRLEQLVCRSSGRLRSRAAAGHREAELLLGRGRRELADDPALVDDEDAVGEREDLLELERDEQDRAALRRAVRRGGGGRTRSRPRRGRASAAPRSAPSGRASTSRASTTFCWFPPESARGRRLRRRRRGRRTPSAGAWRGRACAGAGRASRSASRAATGTSCSARFSASVNVEDEAAALAVLRDVPDAGCRAPRARSRA